MRIKYFAYVSLVSFFSACKTENAIVEDTNSVIEGTRIKNYVIDSCEYIGSVSGANTDILTHKGNCKFCLNRKKLFSNKDI